MLKLIKNWEKATQALADTFVDRYYGESLSEHYWVGDEIGGILVANDQFWNLGDIVDALKCNCSKKRLFEWYDLLNGKDTRQINLKNYAKYGNLNTNNDK